MDDGGGNMTKKCCVCDRLLHDGDEIVALVRSVFHLVPSDVMYAIEQPSECYEMCHSYCSPKTEVRQ